MREVEGEQQGRHEGDEAGLGAALPVVLATGHLGHEVEQSQGHPEEGGGEREIRKQMHRLVEGGPAHQAADVGQQAVQGAAGLDQGLLAQQPQDGDLPQHVEHEWQGGAPHEDSAQLPGVVPEVEHDARDGAVEAEGGEDDRQARQQQAFPEGHGEQVLPLGAGQQQRQHRHHDHQLHGEHQAVEVIHLPGADAHHAAKQQGKDPGRLLLAEGQAGIGQCLGQQAAAAADVGGGQGVEQHQDAEGGDALAPGAEQVIRQLVQVPLAGAEAGFHLQHGGEGHQGPEADHQHQGGGAAQGRGGQRQGQHAGAYGGAGNQQGTTQGLGIHVIHPKVRGAVANKREPVGCVGRRLRGKAGG